MKMVLLAVTSILMMISQVEVKVKMVKRVANHKMIITDIIRQPSVGVSKSASKTPQT